jgi:hypothetical protein
MSMDARYVEAHKSDDVYTLLSEIGFNARMAGTREVESVNRSISITDRGVLFRESKEYKERVQWCTEQVTAIIGRLRNEASAPIALRAVPLEVLKDALAPPVQEADAPHFTEAHVEMLDTYFYMIPKENPDWIPAADEMNES